MTCTLMDEAVRGITMCFLLLLFPSPSVGSLKERALRLMAEERLIDGHNDLPLQLRKQFGNMLSKINLRSLPSTLTDIKRMDQGYLGTQIWSAYTLCSTQNKDAVRLTLEQIDVIKRMCSQYDELELVTSSEGIERTKKISCLIAIEGGHAIDSSLGTLRMFYDLGVRAMALTHTCNTPWAESSSRLHSSFYNKTKGLKPFGEHVIKEMNRLGMIVDLSHTSTFTAKDVLSITKAPVIFSHSSASGVCNHPRNVPDDILQLLKQNKGLVMVNLHSGFISCSSERGNVSSVADHFDHIKKIAGAESIGIGGDYDGADRFPEGLEDVSKYPALIEELLQRGWNETELAGVLRRNFLRVFRDVEMVSSRSHRLPDEKEIAQAEVINPCRSVLKNPHDKAKSSQAANTATVFFSFYLLLTTIFIILLSK
ncbi:dipeptidase 2 isoform X1 [Polypterus senegalus]|uniref:dipeptidase 2 isoform X1 n=2 Tax=Polypterus senegalus TaxID=55291 RepID=UPI001966A581|nr:dipeptidase 2 isoform X1 [Polypterus senegalus]